MRTGYLLTCLCVCLICFWHRCVSYPHFTAEQQNNVSAATLFCTCGIYLSHSFVCSAVSVGNHAVHFVRQLVLEARNGLSGPVC